MNPVENLAHWGRVSVESMYDKTLLRMETENILSWVTPGSLVCDFGCGEGEGTLEYAKVAGSVLAVDNSETRLKFARERLSGCENVSTRTASVLDVNAFHTDIVISQRLLVNLDSWKAQKQAIQNLTNISQSTLILSEGSINGAMELNRFRLQMGLKPIPVPEHNVFIDDKKLLDYMAELGWKVAGFKTLGTYYLLTRGIQPALTTDLKWDSDFNKRSAEVELNLDRFSRIKQWAFRR